MECNKCNKKLNENGKEFVDFISNNDTDSIYCIECAEYLEAQFLSQDDLIEN